MKDFFNDLKNGNYTIHRLFWGCMVVVYFALNVVAKNLNGMIGIKEFYTGFYWISMPLSSLILTLALIGLFKKFKVDKEKIIIGCYMLFGLLLTIMAYIGTIALMTE